MIQLKNVQKFFNKGKNNEIHVINDVTLDLPDVGMVAIFGKSGCGKTTLLNVIGGLDTFYSGELYIHGQNIKSDKDYIRNRYIGYIFQNYNLNKNVNCFDNVADSLRLCGVTDNEEIDKSVTIALKNVGMEHFKNRLPDTLSGGQQQRIAIARAIVKNPSIILADEPTGNLDETNTLMIMNMLKEISKNHLVLLVTHEANLVDHFCDQVIEISDGKIIQTKDNAPKNRYSTKSKHDIYLGDLPKQEENTNHLKVEYFGNEIDEPVHLRLVSHQGKLYLELKDNRVSIIDDTSETKLLDESFSNQIESTNNNSMENLPEINGQSYGKLFHFKNVVIQSLKELFFNKKKSRRILTIALCLFAITIVLLTAWFSIGFSDLQTASKQYNHNVFYLNVYNDSLSNHLDDLINDANSGIDDYWVSNIEPYGDTYLSFVTDFYETYSSTQIETHGVFLDLNLVKNNKILAGQIDDLKDYQIVISQRSADILIKNGHVPFIEEYRDLVGLKEARNIIDGKNLEIAAVVASDEPAFYQPTSSLAKYNLTKTGLNYVYRASDFNIELNEGEAIAYFSSNGLTYADKINDNVMLSNVEMNLKNKIIIYNNYNEYLQKNNIVKKEESDYLKEQYDISKESIDFGKYCSYHHFDYYDYYYDKFDEYFKQFFNSPMLCDQTYASILYFGKGYEVGKFYAIFLDNKFKDILDYYVSYCYKKEHGSYPVDLQVDYKISISSLYNDVYNFYYYEMNAITYNHTPNTYCIVVSDEDYINISKNYGKTSNLFIFRYDSDTDYSMTNGYITLHSTDPDKTTQYLQNNLNVDMNYIEYSTPKDIFNSLIIDRIQDILGNFIILIIMYVVMAICMYFIMHSSLMSKIKEVGMYRAIGVTKKNLKFKFLIDNIVLTTCSVFIGWLIMTIILRYSYISLNAITTIVYYPIWLSLIVLFLLYFISITFGMIPILSLLRKTPSEILSKYDI